MLYNVIQCYSITLKIGLQVGITAFQYYIHQNKMLHFANSRNELYTGFDYQKGA